MDKSIYEINIKKSDGEDMPMDGFNGKVLLIVNTATGCGFTPQYKGLQELYTKYKDSGFEVLDFPCNQFFGQAPGTDEEITSFCTLNYGTTFPRFAKVDVNGKNEAPLFTFLKSAKGGAMGKRIKWNFTKFLVDREGNIVGRYAPATKPEDIEEEIKKLL